MFCIINISIINIIKILDYLIEIRLFNELRSTCNILDIKLKLFNNVIDRKEH